MTRPLLPWLWFALVCAVILGAAGWMGATVWEQDARAQRTGAEALWEQKVQAALWRMDAAASAMVAREAGRKPEEVALLAKEEARQEKKAKARDGGQTRAMARTPLSAKDEAASDAAEGLALGGELALGSAASPAPVAASKSADASWGARSTASSEAKKAAPRYFSKAEPAPAAEAFRESAGAKDAAAPKADAARGRMDKALAAPAPAAAPAFKLPSDDGKLPGNKAAEAQIEAQVANSYAQRAAAKQAFSDNYGEEPADRLATAKGGRLAEKDNAAVTDLTAAAEGGDIVLSRRVESHHLEVVQGVRLDAAAVADELVALVRADFPKAQLRPEPHWPPQNPARTLAAMPLRFFPGEEPVIAIGWSPVRSAVVGAGGALALALCSVALLLARTLALSQRRAEFVSTMTHELRTPLTTFRLYTDLLEAAPDATDRSRYTQVLAREAERLSHLVENVLAYARLEHGKRKPQAEAMPMADLVIGMEDRLRERAGRAGFALEIQGGSGGAKVQAHPASVEQILLNLVDNAGKYAAQAEDKRLALEVGAGTLSLRDFGPGLDATAKKRLFTPFSRSDREAAGHAPGVGLGLSLCRRLARDMGGDLRHEDAAPGARFTLELEPAR